MTALCLCIGIFGALSLRHTLAMRESWAELCPAVPPIDRVAEHASVWCADEHECFVDLGALERETMPLPRGVRLVPDADGLRIDGARGLLARLDLRNGDVLVAIDETPLRDGADLDHLQPAIRRGGFVLHFRRDDVALAKRITFVPARPAADEGGGISRVTSFPAD
jgi:hypothetical protein